jgi:hypothetical protein
MLTVANIKRMLADVNFMLGAGYREAVQVPGAVPGARCNVYFEHRE